MLLNQGLFNQNHAQLLYNTITDMFITHILVETTNSLFCHLSNKLCEDKCRAMLKIMSVNGEQQ